MFAVAQTFAASAHVARKPAQRNTRRGSLQVVANGKGGEEGGKAYGNDVFGMIAKNANFQTLGAAITKSGLESTLTGPGPFTVFAPNDDAFAAAAKQLKITKLELMNLPNLGDIVKYHAIAGIVMSTDLKEGMEATTVNGKTVKISLSGGPSVNGIKIKKADIKVGNGVLHSIDGVLLP